MQAPLQYTIDGQISNVTCNTAELVGLGAAAAIWGPLSAAIVGGALATGGIQPCTVTESNHLDVDCSLANLKKISPSLSTYCPTSSGAGACSFINMPWAQSTGDFSSAKLLQCSTCYRLTWDASFQRPCCLGSITGGEASNYCDPTWCP
jgi:hypothetical protein